MVVREQGDAEQLSGSGKARLRERTPAISSATMVRRHFSQRQQL